MAGWGLHGYFYYPTPAKQGTGCKELVTAKGYDAKGSGKPDITVFEYVDAFGAIADSTNNYAEVMAMIRALEITMEKGLTQVLILADSKYALNGHAQWMHGWARANWQGRQGTEIANVELWKRLHTLDEELKRSGVKILTDHIKGHSGALGNETADRLATSGVFSGFNHQFDEVVVYSDAKGYWGSVRANNRFLAHPFRYFSTQSHVPTLSADGRHIYYTGKMKRADLEMVGKKISDSSLAVVYLREPEPALEVIGDCFRMMGQGTYQGLVIADMSEILKPAMCESLTKFEHRLLLKDFNASRVIDPTTDVILGLEAKPPFLAFRIVETMSGLEQYFNHYLNGMHEFVTTTDITELLYETTKASAAEDKAGVAGKAKKPVVKLKASISPGSRTVEAKANYAKAAGGTGVVDVTLTLDQDIPDRNTLAALAGDDIKVTLLTWPESSMAIRYATVIEVNGDAAIWAGAYANLKLVAP
jgi:ribonuclease HI